ncbi:uncharacterized protein STEHIDRAFT_155267 [Stereum hirsutum FP-91666 SS1]|uniref:uncharacterized protein n=1 Tax=Stereum hirsutum (strain FP-91666) TaxID=721885 RepID=UPI000440B9FA|nr:uncharacterized protein STEHIDRAFT_155267 [Stereum hirsutum FP-91666 SS1]EIM87907.1 hypothetical protein STEHIDRAFT_155267 [Stereum hirsutum FP-91666 SS1]
MSLQKRLMKIVERNPKPRWRDLLEANDYLEHAFTLTPEQRTTITGVKRAIEGADEAEVLVRQKPHWWRWRALKLIISFNRHLSRVSTSAERLSDSYDHLLETDTVSTLQTGDSFLSQIYDLVKRADTDKWGDYDKNEVLADFQWALFYRGLSQIAFDVFQAPRYAANKEARMYSDIARRRFDVVQQRLAQSNISANQPSDLPNEDVPDPGTSPDEGYSTDACLNNGSRSSQEHDSQWVSEIDTLLDDLGIDIAALSHTIVDTESSPTTAQAHDNPLPPATPTQGPLT